MINASIIVPTMNRAESLKIALRSFVGQDYPKEQFEILVVDNGSKDSTKSVVDSVMAQNADCRIRYFFEPVPGLLSGRHRGAREALGDILVFVDDDIQAFPAWLSSIAAAFNDPAVHLVGGPSFPKFETEPPRWMDSYWLNTGQQIECSALSLIYRGEACCRIDPDYIWGLNYAVRKETLYEAGGFHPDCIPSELQHLQGDGESGLSLKIKAKGYQAAYVPGARVIHHIPRTRLTVDYFEKRFFYQGVCASYTQIREKGGTHSIPLPAYKTTPPGRASASLYERYKEIICRRIENAYVDGFQFHHSAVQENSRLLAWVLKENYFDYRLPDLGTAKGSPEATARTPAVKTASAAPVNSRKPESHNPGADTSQCSDDIKLSPKIRRQVETFRNSPARDRQSHMERTLNPLENLEYFSGLKERLIVSGVPVREVEIDREAFDHWRRSVPEIASFYRPGGDVFIEKCLEHYLVFKYLSLSAGDTYIDVAAARSPWAALLNRNRIRAYRLDMAYEKGVHGMDIGADADDTGLPDEFCTGLSLQCAFECFMGDSDVGFIREASRILVPGGRYAIAPLYLETEFFNTTSPLIDQDQVIIDRGARRVWRDDAYVEPFSRMYSPEVFKTRIYSRVPSNTRVEVLYFKNLEEIVNYYQGQRIYCFFMLLGHKADAENEGVR